MTTVKDLGIFLLVLIIVVSLSVRYYEGFIAPFYIGQPWIELSLKGSPSMEHFRSSDGLYMTGPTKCFSCEKQMIQLGLPVHWAHPTKCVDCEAQAIDQHGMQAAFFGQNTKCFDCEAQYANNPFKLGDR